MALHILDTPPSRELRVAQTSALAATERDGLEPWENRKALRDAVREIDAHMRTGIRNPDPNLELYTGDWVHQGHPTVNTVLDIAVALADRQVLEVQRKLRRMTRTQLEAALIAAARTIPLDAPASVLWPCSEDRG